MIFASLTCSLVHLRPSGSADVGQSCHGAGRTAPRVAERPSAVLESVGGPRPRAGARWVTAPSAGHRPRRGGRIKGGAVRGPLTPPSPVAARCPPGPLDPTATTSRAAG